MRGRRLIISVGNPTLALASISFGVPWLTYESPSLDPATRLRSVFIDTEAVEKKYEKAYVAYVLLYLFRMKISPTLELLRTA